MNLSLPVTDSNLRWSSDQSFGPGTARIYARGDTFDLSEIERQRMSSYATNSPSPYNYTSIEEFHKAQSIGRPTTNLAANSKWYGGSQSYHQTTMYGNPLANGIMSDTIAKTSMLGGAQSQAGYSQAGYSQTGYSQNARSTAGYSVGSSVGYSTTRSAAGQTIISERVNERVIRVPKRIVREELYETVVVVPEKRIAEEVIEEEQIIREKIIEVAKPVIQEKYVEVPEYEYREKIIEVPETQVQERITYVPKIETVDRVRHVPRIVRQEKVVEVPQVEYRHVPVVKRVEVPQIQEEIVWREKPVTRYVDKPVPQHKEVEKPYDVLVKVPRPVAAEVVCDFEVPRVREVVEEVEYDVFVPKFVQVPVPKFMVDRFWEAETLKLASHVDLVKQGAVSLAQLEQMGREMKSRNFAGQIAEHMEQHGSGNLSNAFLAGQLPYENCEKTVYTSALKKSGSKSRHRSSRRKSKKGQKETKSFWDCASNWFKSFNDANNNGASKRSNKYSPKDRSSRSKNQTTMFDVQPHFVNVGDEYPVVSSDAYKLNNSAYRSRRDSVYSEDSSYCSSCTECQTKLDSHGYGAGAMLR